MLIKSLTKSDTCEILKKCSDIIITAIVTAIITTTDVTYHLRIEIWIWNLALPLSWKRIFFVQFWICEIEISVFVMKIRIIINYRVSWNMKWVWIWSFLLQCLVHDIYLKITVSSPSTNCKDKKKVGGTQRSIKIVTPQSWVQSGGKEGNFTQYSM